MQSIILAAGMGKRLKSLTEHNTKCMVKVNGITLIERMLYQLDKKHLSKIIIVVGYKSKELVNFIKTLKIKTPIVYLKNNIYYKTNNIYSLALAKKYLEKDDTLIFESDLIFEEAVVDELLNDKYDTLALVDKYESWMDGTCLKLDENNYIEAFISDKNFKNEDIKNYYKTVNIYKFSKCFSKTYYVPFLEAYCKALGNNEYYEQVLKVIAMLNKPEIKAKKLSGQLWYEIDDIQDLDIASSIFANSKKEKLSVLQKRYGGYWRYPKLLDFCYFVNPLFPSKKLMEEIKLNFNMLIKKYPSGLNTNSLLVSKIFDINIENIVVGNGAAELIKYILQCTKGKLGIISPTFDEYANRYDKRDVIKFTPTREGFKYNTTNIVDYFKNKKIKNLIIINPDNPTGNYLSKKEIQNLISWTKKEGIKLIIDESSLDFADDENVTVAKQDVLDSNPHIIVIKSISKSYGVPGLRLGILATGNKNLIKELKKEIPIWNINSFAEFYLQIFDKYRQDYKLALDKIKQERKRFYEELNKNPFIKVFPSQANFLMIKIKKKLTATELTQKLLNEYNILIKDLTGKLNNNMGEYVRIAIKSKEENTFLLNAISHCFK